MVQLNVFITSGENVEVKKVKLKNKLLSWYKVHHRKLPFRENHDPYKIWLSEIMLQQTQMDTVLPYYERFLAAFPTVFDLAKATEEEVLTLWAGLGYYSRARNLHKCACVLVDEYEGNFPEEYQNALKLPGIGPYTAGAVLSIAYNKKVPAVDGNVLRVYSRLFNSDLDIGESKNKKIIEKKIQKLIPENARDFNQALMELGALICLPKNPQCEICPLTKNCKAKALSLQNDLPIKRKKTRNKKIAVAVGIIRKPERIMIVKASTALLNGLWGFPIAEGETQELAKMNLLSDLKNTFGHEIRNPEVIGNSKHVFTHKTWMMTLYKINYTEILKDEIKNQYEKDKSMDLKEQIEWVAEDSLSKYPMATAFKKLLKML